MLEKIVSFPEQPPAIRPGLFSKMVAKALESLSGPACHPTGIRQSAFDLAKYHVYISLDHHIIFESRGVSECRTIIL
jgi:hypothetical protein